MFKFLFKSIFFFVFASFIMGCSEKLDPAPPHPQKAETALIMYLPGRTLLSDFEHNLKQCRDYITAQKMGEKQRVIVCYQPKNYHNLVIKELKYDAKERVCKDFLVKELDNFSASSKQDVLKAFQIAIHHANAEHYGLQIGTHGQAWVKAEDSLSEMVFGKSPFAKKKNMTMSEMEAEFWASDGGIYKTRAFGDPSHRLDNFVLREIILSLNVRFDYLLFDSCFMANIETLYEFRGLFDYIISSPSEIMAAGFPYHKILGNLLSRPESLKENLIEVCRKYWSYYENEAEETSNARSACISLMVMSEIEGVAMAMKEVNNAPQKVYNVEDIQTFEGFATGRHVFFDLGHTVESTCDDAEVVKRFNTALEKFIPHINPSSKDGHYHTEQFWSAGNKGYNPIHHYSGVTTSSVCLHHQDKLQETLWYQVTH